MLATKRSAGVAPEGQAAKHVNDVINPSFEIKTDVTRFPKQGYQ